MRLEESMKRALPVPATCVGLAMFAFGSAAWAVPATKTYTFTGITNPSATHVGFYDNSSSFTLTVRDPAAETGELPSANYRQVAAGDATNTAALNDSASVRHFRFRFRLAEAPATITEIHPYWIGSAETAVTQTLYRWKTTATATWESIGTTTATTDTQIDGGAITGAAILDYVDGSGDFYLAAVAADPGATARQFRTEFVRVVVSYDAPTTAPAAPTALQQVHADGATAIAIGGTTSDKPVVFRATVTDADGNPVRLAIEVQPVGTPFTGIASAEGAAVASGGTAEVSFAPAANTTYHWQAWAIDSFGAAGPAAAFGGNTEAASDFALAGAASTYFVATTGLDPNTTCVAGTRKNDIANPFLTLASAFLCLRTGNPNLTGLGRFAIQIQDGGTYAESLFVETLTATAADNLTVRSRPGQVPRPLVDGGGTRLVGIGVAVPFTVVDGIRFTNFSSTSDYGSGVRINANDCEVRYCEVFATAEFGMTIGFSSGGGEGSVKSDRTYVHHNVFRDIRIGPTGGPSDSTNQGDGVHLMTGSSFSRIENNTFYDCDQSAVYMMGDAAPETDTTIRNNVMVSTAATTRLLKIGTASGGQTGLISDFNTLFRVGGAGFTGLWGTADQATLLNWQTASAKDANSRDLDPLFVDAAGGDMHELSSSGNVTNAAPTTFTNAPAGTCSPAIDAGAPASAWQLEPFNNGMRVNQGAYGYTSQASKSCACLEPLADGADLNDARTALRVCPLVTTVTTSGQEKGADEPPATDTTDFFFFNATVGGPYKFDALITSTAKFDLFLTDAAGAPIASDAPGAVGLAGPGVTRTVTATLTAGALYYLEVRYVSGTSTYSLTATASAPLSSSVLGVRAEPVDSFIRISWETDLDSDALAFRVLRSEQGNTSTVGPDPLPVEIAGAGSYVQDDLDVTCGVRYEYSLEEQSPDGMLVHGPISVTACEAAGTDRDPGGACAGILATSRPPASPLGFAAVAALAVLAALAARPRSA